MLFGDVNDPSPADVMELFNENLRTASDALAPSVEHRGSDQHRGRASDLAEKQTRKQVGQSAWDRFVAERKASDDRRASRDAIDDRLDSFDAALASGKADEDWQSLGARPDVAYTRSQRRLEARQLEALDTPGGRFPLNHFAMYPSRSDD